MKLVSWETSRVLVFPKDGQHKPREEDMYVKVNKQSLLGVRNYIYPPYSQIHLFLSVYYKSRREMSEREMEERRDRQTDRQSTYGHLPCLAAD